MRLLASRVYKAAASGWTGPRHSLDELCELIMLGQLPGVLCPIPVSHVCLDIPCNNTIIVLLQVAPGLSPVYLLVHTPWPFLRVILLQIASTARLCLPTQSSQAFSASHPVPLTHRAQLTHHASPHLTNPWSPCITLLPDSHVAWLQTAPPASAQTAVEQRQRLYAYACLQRASLRWLQK